MNPTSDTPVSDAVVRGLLRARLHTSRIELPNEPECAELEAVALVLAGGATPEAIVRAAEHLRTCASCAQAAQLLHDMDQAPLPQARPAFTPRMAWRWFHRPMAWSAAAACVLLVVGSTVVWHLSTGAPDTLDPDFAIKGQVDRMDVAVLRKGQRFRLRPADQLETGDHLGFFYTAPRAGYLALFDLHASGHLSLLFPRDAAHSGAIAPGSEVPLSDGGTFTRVSGCEWLVGVFSDEPLLVSDVSSALRAAALASGSRCDLQPEIARARTLWLFAAH